jgi:hypothetical protein
MKCSSAPSGAGAAGTTAGPGVSGKRILQIDLRTRWSVGFWQTNP